MPLVPGKLSHRNAAKRRWTVTKERVVGRRLRGKKCKQTGCGTRGCAAGKDRIRISLCQQSDTAGQMLLIVSHKSWVCSALPPSRAEASRRAKLHVSKRFKMGIKIFSKYWITPRECGFHFHLRSRVSLYGFRTRESGQQTLPGFAVHEAVTRHTLLTRMSTARNLSHSINRRPLSSCVLYWVIEIPLSIS